MIKKIEKGKKKKNQRRIKCGLNRRAISIRVQYWGKQIPVLRLPDLSSVG